MRYLLYRWSWAALDLLFPPTCGGCDQQGVRWCQECQDNTILITPPYCELCGQSNNGAKICDRCSKTQSSMKAVRSWAVFDGPVRKALHRVKYHRDLALADDLSQALGELYRSLGWTIDIVIPVPLSNQRKKERGYNQAALLARPLAWELGLDYQPQALSRLKDTRSQVGLNVDQRRENVAGAFDAVPKLVSKKKVLIVDDVATSGSTLEACANALKHAGADDIFGITLARATQNTSSA